MVWLRHRVWLAGIACACAASGLTGCDSGQLQCYVPPLRTWGIEVTSAGQVRWQTRLPLREGFFGWATAPLAAGPVAIFSQNDDVYALRLADGHRVWSWSSRGPVQGTFQWKGLVVVLAAGPRTGSLTGLDAATGQIRWRRQIGEPVPGSAVATADGGLAVVADGLEVFNLSDGRVRWAGPAGAIAVSGTSVLAAGGTTLTSYDDRTGKVRWTEALTPIQWATSPGELGLEADAGLVYLTGVQQQPPPGEFGTPVVLGINAANGHVKWRFTPTAAWSADVVGPGLVNVEADEDCGPDSAGCRESVSRLDDLSPVTGRIRWQMLDYFSPDEMFFAGGRLIAGISTSNSERGLLSAIRRADGHRVWQVTLPTVVKFPLGAVPGGLLVYASAVNNAC
jgi:outer membrane protein assembly factor BamB